MGRWKRARCGSEMRALIGRGCGCGGAAFRFGSARLPASAIDVPADSLRIAFVASGFAEASAWFRARFAESSSSLFGILFGELPGFRRSPLRLRRRRFRIRRSWRDFGGFVRAVCSSSSSESASRCGLRLGLGGVSSWRASASCSASELTSSSESSAACAAARAWVVGMRGARSCRCFERRAKFSRRRLLRRRHRRSSSGLRNRSRSAMSAGSTAGEASGRGVESRGGDGAGVRWHPVAGTSSSRRMDARRRAPERAAGAWARSSPGTRSLYLASDSPGRIMGS